jgi:two-component system sensor histidine kinase SenX3
VVTTEGFEAPVDSAAVASDAGAVLATVAEALESGAVLLDGDEVILANEAALALRVVLRRRLVSPVLSVLVREARRDSRRVAHDIELPWGAGTRAVHAVAAPVPGTRQVVLLLTDLEEVRRVEAVRRDFIANVSHELKTPVGALMLLAEAVRDGIEDPAAALHFAERMVHEANRLSRLVQELLDLSRLQGGEPLPTLDAVSVAELIDEVHEILRIRAEASGITIVTGNASGLQVWGDRRLLVTALTNLIDNAIAYSAPGTKVGIGARLVESEGADMVDIAVSDEGVGIPVADQERVFERFFRVDTARSRATGGTGLGLAIVKHIVNNHGGHVSLWSRPGVGSTFTLHLPVPPQTVIPAVASAISAHPPMEQRNLTP